MFPAEAGIAHAAPRQPHIGIAIGVDPDGAGIRFLRETLHASDVSTPNARGKAVGSAVGDPKRISFVAKLDDTHHGTENFFLRDAHLVLDVCENRAADEVAAVADTLAASRQQCALVLADIHVIEDALQLLFGDYRPKGCGTIGRIPHPDRLRALREPVEHLVVNLLVREDARTRRAYLPRVEEDSGRSGLDRSLDVGAGKDDVGGLAAEFERHAFEVTRRAAQNSASHTRRSGEGDLVYIRMIDESVADDPTRAGDDIQDSRRQARLRGHAPRAARPTAMSARRASSRSCSRRPEQVPASTCRSLAGNSTAR